MFAEALPLLVLCAVVAAFLVGPTLAALARQIRQEQALVELRATEHDVRRNIDEITRQAQGALLAEVTRHWRDRQ